MYGGERWAVLAAFCDPDPAIGSKLDYAAFQNTEDCSNGDIERLILA